MRTLTISILIIAAVALSACSGGKSEILNRTWQWETYQDTAGLNDLSVAYPENYTLTLNEDGTASIKADCNQVIWSYQLNESRLTFDTNGLTTLAMCPEDSLDQLFLERLGNTATFILEEGILYLNLVADGGNMVFRTK